MIILFLCLFILAMLPFIIKICFLYIAYLQWALLIPVPFSIRLWGKKPSTTTTKKPPIGFHVPFSDSSEENSPEALLKKKK